MDTEIETGTVAAAPLPKGVSTPVPRRRRPLEHKWVLWAAVVLGVVLLAASPLALNNYWLRIVTTALMFGALGQALNVIVGLAGYPALGNVVFFGVGAYAAAILSSRDILPPALALIAAGPVAGVFALLVARAMLSLRGAYFLMATVALNGLVQQVAVVSDGLTHGPRGLNVPALVTGDSQLVYSSYLWMFMGLAAVCALVLVGLRRTRMGFGMLAIRGNESAAEALGIPTFRYKTIAWVLSAMLTGWVGAVYAFWLIFIDPATVFDLLLSLTALLMVLIGGRWLVFGPLIGAALIEYLDVTAWSKSTELHEGILGLAIVVLVVFLPGGVSEVPAQIRRRLSRSRRSRGELARDHAA